MIVLMLGNGFDLHYEFPTQYINFMHTCSFIREYYDQSFTHISDVFDNPNFPEDEHIKNCVKKYATSYSKVSLDDQKMQKLKKGATKNTWFRYFNDKCKTNISWIDFEGEIQEVIKLFSDLFSEIDDFSKTHEKPYYIDNDSFRKIVLDAFNLLDSDGDKVDKKVIVQNGIRRRTYYFQKRFYFKPFGTSDVELLNKEKMVEELSDSLKQLSQMLSTYLECFVNGAIGQCITDGTVQISKYFETAEKVISFNYTNTYELLYPAPRLKNFAISHIHGTLDKEIVLGVNADKSDDLATIDTLFLAFKKYYQRVIFKTDEEYLKIVTHLKNIALAENRKQAIELVVFGHSLDVTDKEAIRELFQYANTVKIFYYSSSAQKQMVKNLVTILGKEGFDFFRMKKSMEFIPSSNIN